MNREKNEAKKRKYVFDEEGVEALGLRIRKLRENAKITKTQVCAETGVSRSHLTGIEEGRISPSVSVVFYLSRMLEINPDEFFKYIRLSPSRSPLKRED